MRIAPGFIIRQIAGEAIAIPSGDAAHCLSGLVALNESGKLLFELLQTEQTEDALVQALLDAYEIDAATAAADVSDFLKLLQDHCFLITSH